MKKSVRWGIPVPGDPEHVDLRLDRRAHELPDGAGRARRGRARRRGKAAFWAASNHLIAKDILRFHAVYWPAMLMERGPAAAQAGLLPRLPDREGAEDLEVDPGDQGRPERDRRRAGRRSAALLRAARVHARRRRRLHLRGAVPALRVGPRQRPRQPAEPHDVDGAQVRRRDKLDGRASRDQAPTIGRLRSRPRPRTAWEAFSPVGRAARRPGDRPRGATATSTKQKPWVLREGAGRTARRLHGVLGRLLRDAALGGADGRAGDARRGARRSCASSGREQDEGNWPGEVGLAGRHARPSRSRSSRASSPSARRR